MLKRYLVFAGSTYYPAGGWGDFRTSCDTVEEAKDWLLKWNEDYDWWQIADAETLTKVDGHCRSGVRD